MSINDPINGVPEEVSITVPSSLPLSQQTYSNATMTGSSQTVTLNNPSQSIDIENTGTNMMHFNFAGTSASTSNTPLPPGSSYNYRGVAVSSFGVIGTSDDILGVVGK